MRTAFVLFFTAAACASALGANQEKMYFLGEVKLGAADGKPMGSRVILLEKIHDRDHSKIVERALVVEPDGKVEQHTMNLTVKDDNTFTLVDDTKDIQGSGQLFGPAWKWTYFKGTFKSKSGVQIDDENFMADDSVIVARKKISAPDGKVLMFMDMSLKSVTPKTYDILRATLLKDTTKIDLKLPAKIDSDDKDDDYRIAVYSQSGRIDFITFKAKHLEPEELPAKDALKSLRAKVKSIPKPAKGKLPLIKIECDKNVKYSELMELMNICREEGFTDVGIVPRSPAKKGGTTQNK
jgi:biopolymer transport protein ExbD